MSQPPNFDSKTPESSLAIPEVFIQVKFNNPGLLDTDDINQNVKFLHHLRFINLEGQVHLLKTNQTQNFESKTP